MAQIFCLILVLIVGALLGFGLAGRYRSGEPSESIPVIVGNIETIADLVVLRIPVSKVTRTHIGGYLGGVDCILLINGDVEISTDIARTHYEDVNTEARTATLVLNEPEVRRVRLDHQRTSVYTIDRRGLWCILPAAEPERQIVNRAMNEAEKLVEAAGEDAQLIDRSKRQTEVIVSQYVEAMGWEVNVVWCDDNSKTNKSIADIPDR